MSDGQQLLWKPTSAVRVLEALQSLAAPSGLVTASQLVIASQCDLSIRQLRRLLDRLEHDGFISRMRRGYRLSEKRTSMADADTQWPMRTPDGRCGHPMADADTLRSTENKMVYKGQKSTHKEERARVAAAAKNTSSKSRAAARPPLAEVFEVLRPYVNNWQRVGEMIFDGACANAPTITSIELAKLLQAEVELGFKRLREGKITSLPGVLVSWARGLGVWDVEEFREQERHLAQAEAQAAKERERRKQESAAEVWSWELRKANAALWEELRPLAKQRVLDLKRAQPFQEKMAWFDGLVDVAMHELWAARGADG